MPGIGSPRRPETRSPVDTTPVKSFHRSELYQLWKDRVVNDDNDLIVAIAASSRTPISGTGKTTLACTLAEEFDASKDGFDAEAKASLDSARVAEELYPNLPQRSCIVFDEAQGTLGSDGVDSRRAMANAVVKMSRSAAQYRKRQHTLLIVAQSTDWLDSRMMDLIDRLVLIQEKNPTDEYARAVTFDHYREDLPSNTSAKEYTPAIEDLYWEPLPMDNPNYAVLDELKEQANGQESEDENGDGKAELTDKQRKELARTLYQDYNLNQRQVGDHPMIDRSQQWVSKVVNGHD